MPEDSKKNQHRNKHEAKEQRKPRQSRQHAGEKSEKKSDEQKAKTAQPKPQGDAKPKPQVEEPGPEFYKNLKRETDEILKITEETNAKFKKKEIQSNWAKYEMPVETYEEIEEQENLGADYEKLIQAPLSVGGHFQFKHEKSWDVETGPSLYDKYFEINMDDLATAISTVPFYERNSIEPSIFTQSDRVNMDNRSVRYKRKYFNDKSYTTPELEALDQNLNNIKEVLSKNEDKSEEIHSKDTNITKLSEESEDINLEGIDQPHSLQKSTIKLHDNNVEIKNKDIKEEKLESKPVIESKNDTIATKITSTGIPRLEEAVECLKLDSEDVDDIDDLIFGNTQTNASTAKVDEVKTVEPAPPPKVTESAENLPKEIKNQVIESPEDLEKWLDDFLDG